MELVTGFFCSFYCLDFLHRASRPAEKRHRYRRPTLPSSVLVQSQREQISPSFASQSIGIGRFGPSRNRIFLPIIDNLGRYSKQFLGYGLRYLVIVFKRKNGHKRTNFKYFSMNIWSTETNFNSNYATFKTA